LDGELFGVSELAAGFDSELLLDELDSLELLLDDESDLVDSDELLLDDESAEADFLYESLR
jgi:hypothetical protein